MDRGTFNDPELESRPQSAPEINDQRPPNSNKPTKVLNRGQERYAGIQKELSKVYRETGGKKEWGEYRNFQRSEAARSIWRKGNVGTSNEPDLESKQKSVPENNDQRSSEPTETSKVLNRGQERYAGIQKELSKVYRETGGKKEWGEYRNFQRSEAARSIWRKGNVGTSNEPDLESKQKSVPENNDQRPSNPNKPSKMLNRGQERYAGIQKELSKVYRETGGKKHWGEYRNFQRSEVARGIWKGEHVKTAKQLDSE